MELAPSLCSFCKTEESCLLLNQIIPMGLCTALLTYTLLLGLSCMEGYEAAGMKSAFLYVRKGDGVVPLADKGDTVVTP